jgi:hypothetical protein
MTVATALRRESMSGSRHAGQHFAMLIPAKANCKPVSTPLPGQPECLLSSGCLNLLTADASLIAKPERESANIRRGRWYGVACVSSERRIFPRRYQANAHQPHTLIGLTADETLEFERLDRLSPVDHLGNCVWNFEGEPKTFEEKRWLELYRKHENGWSDWLAAEGGWVVAVPRASTL